MFALFYMTTVAVCKVISGTKNLLTNAMSRSEAKLNRKTGYWDTNGAYRDPFTDMQIHYEKLDNGDRIIVDINGNIVRNIDEEQRLSMIAHKNVALREAESPVVLIGKFEDVCPDKVHNGIWKHVPNKAAVYADKIGSLYFRQPACGSVSLKDLYIRVSDGKYEFLDKASESDKLWLDKANKGWNEGRISFITLNKLVDRVY